MQDDRSRLKIGRTLIGDEQHRTFKAFAARRIFQLPRRCQKIRQLQLPVGLDSRIDDFGPPKQGSDKSNRRANSRQNSGDSQWRFRPIPQEHNRKQAQPAGDGKSNPCPFQQSKHHQPPVNSADKSLQTGGRRIHLY